MVLVQVSPSANRYLPLLLLVFLWTLLGWGGYWLVQQNQHHQAQQTHILALQIEERLKTFAKERQAALKQLAAVWPLTHPNTENWFYQEAGNLQNMLPGLSYLAWQDGQGRLRISRRTAEIQGCEQQEGSTPISPQLGQIRYRIALCQVLPTILDSALATGFAAEVQLGDQTVYRLGQGGDIQVAEQFPWFGSSLRLSLSPSARLGWHLYLMIGAAMLVVLMLSVLIQVSLKRAWALNRSRVFFQGASQAAMDGLLVLSPGREDWSVAEHNAALVRILPVSPGLTLMELCQRLQQPALAAELMALPAQAGSLIRQFGLPDGRWLQLQGVAAGENLAITLRDITELKLKEQDLADREAKYRRLIEGLRGHLIFTLDEQGQPAFISKGGAELFGQREATAVLEELRGHNRWQEAKARLLAGESSVRLQLPLALPELGERRVEVALGKVEGGFEGILRDVTDEAELLRRIRHQAAHDALTGLANRYAFDKALGLAWESGEPCQGLLLMDLDQFKLVNDRFGHELGDALLVAVAQRLELALGGKGLLARLGGDEFAVLLQGDHQALDGQADALRQALCAEPLQAGPHQFSVTASLGLVPFGAAPDPQSLKRIADMAAYAAKEAGGNRLQCYREGDGWLKAREEMMAWADKLRLALEQDRLVLAVQSIALAQHPNRVAHREVLVRLLDEAGQLVPAGRFIPAAERYGLMVALDRAVITKGLAWLAGQPQEKLAFNLSGASLSDQGFCRWLLDTLAKSSVAAEQLCFEVTETAVIEHLGHAVELMDALKAQGCTLSLDDFGSGMSSLSYLKALPVDHIKIDGAFVREIKHTHFDRVAVRTIASLARALGKMTIAEYVTDEATLALLKRLGVDMVQGYAIDEPQPLEQLRLKASAS
ncbi:EAL domain-containing protein [Gallaecimonas kandeliae]|uniref:putative bifunctional diguanylate cyclase/phosphodiesterase n=1 Tax=Gallaecimonas kandeliae TaxID=3029055 RepID=UPI002647700D|nr:EAL domain-containing protein [Gallaecimonas kandeliae]WKE67293.1 EAL domain-containing protein [Gallaecimonas kandeliae]